jgi:hypothetical protein
MPADRAPRRKSTGEGLVNKILRHVPVTDADQDSAEAIIRGSAVELREVQPLGSHTHLTHNRRAGTTWLVSAPRVPGAPISFGRIPRHISVLVTAAASQAAVGVVRDRFAFLEAPGQIITDGDTITVWLERRAYSPALRQATLPQDPPCPDNSKKRLAASGL